MSTLEEIVTRGHEEVLVYQEPEVGLCTIIAVHNTTLGPALGGCRMRPYESLDLALTDVLRLSEAMTYKNSLCGINFGGGKSVIVKDSAVAEGRAALFEGFGRRVQRLAGKYITAEDMGTSVSDMTFIMKTCEYVAGREPAKGGAGDPSPYTSLGIFDGMRACLERSGEPKDISQCHVAIQGVGNVGMYLCERLVKAGAKVTVTDVNGRKVEALRQKYGVSVVGVKDIFSVSCDIFAPCAAGGILTQAVVSKLQCRIVAGAANNQLADNAVEKAIAARGILYAPDFAINAGGVILCADEYEPGGFTESRVLERVKNIYHTVGKILDEARRTGTLAGEVAVRLARERIENVRNARQR